MSTPGWSVDVDCTATDAGWQCRVAVDDGRGTSRQDVTVGAEDAQRLAEARSDDAVERLVFETMDFLLEREPKGSILRSFDISVVAVYFPEYDQEIRSRLAP
jgi:hypothetical protein